MQFYTIQIFRKFIGMWTDSGLLYKTFEAACDAIETELEHYPDFTRPDRAAMEKEVLTCGYVRYYESSDVEVFQISIMTLVE